MNTKKKTVSIFGEKIIYFHDSCWNVMNNGEILTKIYNIIETEKW